MNKKGIDREWFFDASYGGNHDLLDLYLQEAGALQQKGKLGVEPNLMLVVDIARKYFGHGEFLDRIQNGNLGLMKAAKIFEKNRGYKFSTLATKCIRTSIQRGVDNGDEPIRRPVYAGALERKINRISARLEAQGEEVNNEVLSEEIGKEMNDRAKKKGRRVSPKGWIKMATPDKLERLQTRLDRSKTIPLEAVEIAVDIEAIIEHELRCWEAVNFLRKDGLKPKEKEVLELRFFGDPSGELMSWEKIGKRVKVSEVTAAKIAGRGLKKLRQHFLS